ncbi:hypothetical protein MRX96_010668 [Rhipicephalus microplus]
MQRAVQQRKRPEQKEENSRFGPQHHSRPRGGSPAAETPAHSMPVDSADASSRISLLTRYLFASSLPPFVASAAPLLFFQPHGMLPQSHAAGKKAPPTSETLASRSRPRGRAK